MNRSLRHIAKVLLRPLKPILDKELDFQVRSWAALRSIENTETQDIFIVGYLKSGNTWMQYLLAGLMFGIDMRIGPHSLVQHLITDVHSERLPPLSSIRDTLKS